MVNGTDGTIPYSSTNASKVINFAVGNCSSSGNVFFKTGQYALNGSIIDNGVGHITLIFEDGAKLYVPNGMNQPAIYLSYVNYWSIEGVEIDGNAANQGAPSGAVHADGIVMNFCNFSTVKDGYIYNCRRFGINIIGASHGSGADGNTVLTCGWNGINLGGATDTFDCYATDNLVAYFSDVGITSYCNDGRITGNTVYAANGTTGSNNAGWGIASEALGNCTIADNTVYNVTYGIRATVGCHRVEIKDNRIYQVSNVGIYLEGSNYTSLDGNMVWSWGAFAVQLDVSHWVKIRGNTLNGTYGIFTNSDYGFCMGNWISASDYGIAAASGANYTRIIENDLRFCSSSIYEAGGAGNIYGNNVWSNGTYDNTPP
jgi:parallel beta-helix repeat protein